MASHTQTHIPSESHCSLKSFFGFVKCYNIIDLKIHPNTHTKLKKIQSFVNYFSGSVRPFCYWTSCKKKKSSVYFQILIQASCCGGGIRCCCACFCCCSQPPRWPAESPPPRAADTRSAPSDRSGGSSALAADVLWKCRCNEVFNAFDTKLSPSFSSSSD